jgi:hypothetical protein
MIAGHMIAADVSGGLRKQPERILLKGAAGHGTIAGRVISSKCAAANRAARFERYCDRCGEAYSLCPRATRGCDSWYVPQNIRPARLYDVLPALKRNKDRRNPAVSEVMALVNRWPYAPDSLDDQGDDMVDLLRSLLRA